MPNSSHPDGPAIRPVCRTNRRVRRRAHRRGARPSRPAGIDTAGF